MSILKQENTSNKLRIKKWVKLMGNVVSALSILFVIAAFLKIDFRISSITDWKSFGLVCIAGVLLKAATVCLSASAWRKWLEFFAGKRCDRSEALRVYAKANIGKYLPGNVMHYVERNLFAGKLMLSQKRIAAATLMEVFTLALTAFFVSACLAFTKLQEVLASLCAAWGLSKTQLTLAGIVAGILFFSAMAVTWKKREKLQQIAREKLGVGMAGKFVKTFLVCFVLYTAVLTILGIILVLIYKYWGGQPSLEQAVLMIAAYMIAWVLGFVIPGAPGGIGVRELALTLLLAPVVGSSLIATLSVLHRLITVAGDFAAYLFVIVRPYQERNEKYE